MNQNTSLLEIGCGEATTLAGVVNRLNPQPNKVFGFDISWSRCVHANKWLNEKKVNAEIFVSDLFEIPFQDSSIDIVYTSHSLEPNGGQELLALKELLRVARRKVVLIEPLFELASTAAQKRMEEHGYVKNLKGVAESLGFSVSHYGLLDFIENPLNPSGMLVIDKTDCVNESLDHSLWRCPMTHFPLEKVNECFYSAEGGILYPIVEGVPMLHQKNAIIGSAFEAMTKR